MRLSQKASLPRGFLASGISCGIKRSGKPDYGLFYSSLPARVACTFTRNTLKAAPVEVNEEILRTARTCRAILVNSGNANCFTGKAGRKDTLATGAAVRRALGLAPGELLYASTGIIGKRLPAEKMIAAVPRLIEGLNRRGIGEAAKAILTTDSGTKEVTARTVIGAERVTLCGVAKGAGMIAPDMATMLCFVMTDAAVSSRALKSALREAVDDSFNCISVDGCMSTNDSVMLLANGAAGNKPVDSGPALSRFKQALHAVCRDLARKIVLDGEGAGKYITLKVSGARTKPEAKKVALEIAGSVLFKTAMYGENPNYGRIVASVGASGVNVSQERLKIRMSPLHKRGISVNVHLGRGGAHCTVYTTDMTPEYIRINAEYS